MNPRGVRRQVTVEMTARDLAHQRKVERAVRSKARAHKRRERTVRALTLAARVGLSLTLPVRLLWAWLELARAWAEAKRRTVEARPYRGEAGDDD